MDEEQLAAIEAELRRHDEELRSANYWSYVMLRSDVPRLVAEVRRLRAARSRTARRLRVVREVARLWEAHSDGWHEEHDLVAEERDRLRAALAELVWVTNILGTDMCDYCGVPRAEPVGKPDCSCELLRAALGTGEET